ncbi:MAG: hypothetical protein K9W44_13995 [Candidatus Lokiarchaeota archaeon]|nr:hypothetical protein [Candidatus Harpocratesius repetitus]
MNHVEFKQDIQKIDDLSKKNNVQNEKNKEKNDSWREDSKKQLIRKLLGHSLEFLLLFLIGTSAIFFTFRLLIHDPWLTMTADFFNEARRKYIEEQKALCGWNDPFLIQYFTYLKNFLSGKWGTSISTIINTSNTEIFFIKIPKTIQLFFLAFLFSIIPSILLGIISGNKHGSKIDRIILAFTAVLFVLPTGVIGTLFQFIFSGKLKWFPASCFISRQNLYYKADMTGYILIDSVIKGDFGVFWDVLNHLFMPSFVISFGITAIGILFIRWLVISRKNQSFSFPSRNYILIAFVFFYFSLILLINEFIFELNGFLMLIIQVINNYDFYLIINSLTLLFVFFQLFVFLSDIGRILLQYHKMKKDADAPIQIQYYSFLPKIKSEKSNKTDDNLPSINKKPQLIPQNTRKNHLLFKYTTLVNSFEFIFGGFLLILTIIFVNLAESFYTQDLFTNIAEGVIPWSAPSFEHFLGTGHFGHDVLGFTLYGYVFPLTRVIPIAIIVGFAGICIGFFLTAKFPRFIRFFNFIEKIFIIIPIVFIVFLIWLILERISRRTTFPELVTYAIFSFILGFIAGKGIGYQSRKKDIKINTFFIHLKNSSPILLSYLFIIASLMIMVEFTIEFMGYKTPSIVSWGREIYYGIKYKHFYDAPWAVFSLMIAYYILILALIMICLSFFNLLHNNNQKLKF